MNFDSELEEASVIRDFRITANDGKNDTTQHYNLSAMIVQDRLFESDFDKEVKRIAASQKKNGGAA
ncbi:MAG: hypothetical protein ACR2PX_08495 [Endozoicomonas sp.]|uniref:hypothetical protein n=1 Tax=Endozoicomonas sp. TaxID=1892382 RepID=UPI003D9B38E0